MSKFGERVRELRGRKFSQQELADTMNVSSNTVWRWEAGQRTPDIEKLRALARILNTTVGYLTGETDDPTPAQKKTDALLLLDVGSSHIEADMMKSVKGIINSTIQNAGRDANITTAPERTQTDTMPLWVTLPQAVYQVVQNGTQQDISDTLNAMRQGITVLERAEQKFSPA